MKYNPTERIKFDDENKKIPSVSFSKDEFKKIDTKLLGKFTDRELSKKWGINRIRILRLRNILGIKACEYNYNHEGKLNQILDFLKQNENNIITIQEFQKLGIFMINNILLTKTAIKELAEKHNIKVTFKNDQDYEHSHSTYLKGCRCDICKLTATLHVKYTRLVSVKFCNFIANEFIDLYKNDTSKFHRQFFSFVEEEIEKGMEKNEEETTEIQDMEDSSQDSNIKFNETDIKANFNNNEKIRQEYKLQDNFRQELLKNKFKINNK